MPRWTERLLIVVAVLAVAFGGAFLALVIGFPPERIAALAAEQVSARTGRDFRIEGKLAWRALPRIAVVADGLVLGNAPWGSRKEMLRVERAALELELWPLLRGELKVGSVELDGVDLLLETDAQGAGNWILSAPGQGASGAPAGRPAGGPAARPFALDALHLRDVTVAYRDRAAQHTLALARLDLARNDRGNRIDAEGTIRKQRWRASGELGPIDVLLGDAADWPFDLELTAEGARIGANGQLLHGTTPRAVRLSLDARLDKPAAFAAWIADADRIALPIEIKSTLAAAGGALKADPLTLSVAGQRLAGRATWRSGAPWQLDAMLKADRFDLAGVLSRRAGGGAGAPAPGGDAHPLFGDRRLPFDALPDAIAKVELRFDQLHLPGAPPLSGVTANLHLERGVLRAEPLVFGVAGGRVRGGVTLAAGSSPRLSVQLDAADMSAEALARAAGDTRVGGGQVQLKTALAMTGNTPRALAASANGDLLLTMKDMTLAGGALSIGPNLLPRLLQILQPQRGTAKATTVECAVARLPFRNGVAAVDRSIAAETSDLTFSASGRIDLRDQTLELAIRPGVRNALAINPAQLASLVVAKGPLLEPKLTLDARGVASAALSIGAAAATGGLSALGQGLVRQASDPHPCVFAQTGVAAKPAAQPASPGAPGGSKPPAGQPDDVRKLLRNLFR